MGDHSTATPVSSPVGGASPTAPRAWRLQPWWPWLRRMRPTAAVTSTRISLVEAVCTHTGRG